LLRVCHVLSAPCASRADDPAFFGGDLNANYRRCAADCDLTAAELAQLARNSFQLSFCKDAALKRSAFAEIDALVGSAAAPLASLPL
jgi:adenosine deaminase